MNVLLDTHIVLWWLNGNDELSDSHKEIISNTDNLCYVGAGTILEIHIKSKPGKLKISDNYIDELKKVGFLEISINWIHSNQVKNFL
ncbi:MAG: hypothetical protein JXC36_06370 [Candidatus Atribacteria bacterium]|nr:hypothetical protein [Candidatus Atribacteria bacterium]